MIRYKEYPFIKLYKCFNINKRGTIPGKWSFLLVELLMEKHVSRLQHLSSSGVGGFSTSWTKNVGNCMKCTDLDAPSIFFPCLVGGLLFYVR